MKILNRIYRCIGFGEEIVSAAAMISMCGVVVAGVICRFILEVPFPASEEIARYLMIWTIYIGLAYATRQNAHIGVEIIFRALSPRGEKTLKVIIRLISSAAYVWISVLGIIWIMKSAGPNPQLTPLTRIPYWYMYSSIAIGFGLSALHSLLGLAGSLKGTPGGGKAGQEAWTE